MKVKEWYSASDVVKILKAAKSADVHELTLGGLSVKFSAVAYNNEVTPKSIPNADEIQMITEKNMVAMSEKELKDEMLTQMAISDPAAYEDLISEGDLDG